MKTLNVIGAGRVGRTLALLWRRAGTFRVGGVLGRAVAGAQAAVDFIGEGRAADDPAGLPPAEVWMLTPPDHAIEACCAGLAQRGLLRAGDVVFHCSGALGADMLRSAAAAGATVASVHPLKSFAEAQAAARTFGGTYCVAEGEAAALATLRPAFEAIGARVAEIDPRHKVLYHAAGVIVCNYLVALVEGGLRCYEMAGISRDTAVTMMAPLVRETVDNVFRLGTARALTGPIARGDEAVVAHHLDALGARDPQLRELYRQLGAIALDLARTRGEVDAEALARLTALLAAPR